MKKPILILLFILSNKMILSQDISCNELMSFIHEEGYLKSTLMNFTLNSKWLYEVKAYSYDNSIFVEAKIKKNEYSFETNTYIFCGIPSINWSNFQYGSYGENSTYGERFHKYIFDYQCDCK